MKIEYAVQIAWSTEDNAYIAMPAELPGCMADGSTPEEALSNLREVIREWIDVAKEEGRPIPSPMSVQEFAKQQERAQQEFQQVIQQQIHVEVEKVVSVAAKQIGEALKEQQQSSGYPNTGFQLGSRINVGDVVCGIVAETKHRR